MERAIIMDLLIRFIFGGSAIVASTIFARKIGGTIGGIFAAFPAVYLAALVTVTFGDSPENLIPASILLSRGALIGMLTNIITAMVASYAIRRSGWRIGLMISLLAWLILSFTASLIIQTM